MKGIIKIIGEIGEEVTLINVMEQVKSQPNSTSFDVIVNSVGGCVVEGWNIAKYLSKLPPTNGIGEEKVCSIATVIYGHCTTRENNPQNPAKFMMHLPMGDMGQGGTADEIEAFGKRVREEEDKLCKFYADLMGFDKDTIKSLISTDTYLTLSQMEAFGITTKEPTKIVAKAYFNSNTDKSMSNFTEEDKNWLQKKFEQFEEIFNKNKPEIKNIVLQDANGVSLDFESLEEGQSPALGDMATVDGDAANGDYLMPSGETFVFADGVLTEIMAVVEDEEVEALKTENASLKEQLETLNTTVENQAKEIEAKQEVVDSITEDVKKLKSEITSKFDVDLKAKGKKEEKGEISAAVTALERLKNKRQNK